MPIVSVIIPIFNVEKYLSRCLESICNQTISDIEIICVDDGSTDNCASIIKEFEQKDARIRAFQQPNQGQGAARNTGLKNATSEWITFIDSDDWVAPNYIEDLFRFAADGTSVDLVCSGYTEVHPKNKTIKRQFVSQDQTLDGDDYRNRLRNSFYQKSIVPINFGIACGKLYQASIIKRHNILFYAKMYVEDFFFNCNYSQYVNTVCVSADCVYYYNRMNQSSSTKKKLTNLSQVVLALYNAFDRFSGGFWDVQPNAKNLCAFYYFADRFPQNYFCDLWHLRNDLRSVHTLFSTPLFAQIFSGVPAEKIHGYYPKTFYYFMLKKSAFGIFLSTLILKRILFPLAGLLGR